MAKCLAMAMRAQNPWATQVVIELWGAKRAADCRQANNHLTNSSQNAGTGRLTLDISQASKPLSLERKGSDPRNTALEKSMQTVLHRAAQTVSCT
eukprot:CAMPEP_0117581840 /NCGR_PEP_ID=MMETSP0784-20121206/66076_1 /TAXON_ID=39447 /ORGANISM="" /LENGTH=94 /DNA_ID=CAMNT_0005382247 /DNA_START=38 /DNA_END=323 /DNA_ORIENTATION=+